MTTSIEEAQILMKQLISYRETANLSGKEDDIKAFRKHETLCVQKFSYLIKMRTGRYREFLNYDDLNQEGMEALLKAMSNYNPGKASFYYWAHQYIGTKIARAANQHTTIRYPMAFSKATAPRREAQMPIIVSSAILADEELETSEMAVEIRSIMSFLSEQQRAIVSLAFGFGGDNPMPVDRISKKLRISSPECETILNAALEILKNNIEI